jgi:phosphoglycolate phosphatase-like HAD superfamily hydrolase
MSSPPALAFGAAVFDCDGTLVETRELWRAAFEAVVGEPVSESVLGERLGSFFEVLVPSEELDPPSDTGRTSTCERARS